MFLTANSSHLSRQMPQYPSQKQKLTWRRFSNLTLPKRIRPFPNRLKWQKQPSEGQMNQKLRVQRSQQQEEINKLQHQMFCCEMNAVIKNCEQKRQQAALGRQLET